MSEKNGLQSADANGISKVVQAETGPQLSWGDRVKLKLGLAEIVEVPDEPGATAPTTPTTSRIPPIDTPRPTAPAARPSTLPTASNAAQPDPEMLKLFQAAVDKVPTPGYKRLQVTLDGLGAAGIPENMRMAGALGVLKGEGVTAAVVGGELDQIDRAVDAEGINISKYISDQTKNDIETETKRVLDIDAQVAEHQQTIAKLQAEIEKLTNDRKTGIDKIDGFQREKADLESRFTATIAAVKAKNTQLRADLSKVLG
jgi:hypothetical protein